MKEELGGYETRLLAELTEVVEKRSASRSWFTMPKLAMGGVALAALAVTGGLTLPVFGGASERSPNPGLAAAPPPEQEVEVVPAGFSLAVDEVAVMVTIDDIQDDAGLEAALEAEGIASNVTYLPGSPQGCEWAPFESPAQPPPLATSEEPGGGLSILLPRSGFADGEVLLVAVYETGDGLHVGVEVAASDPGECVAVD